jgi:TolB protein
MLTRAYRLTDKFGIAALKLGAGLSGFLVERTAIITRTGQSGVGGIFSLLRALILGLIALFGMVASRLRDVLRWLFRQISRVLTAVFGVASGVGQQVGRAGKRASHQAITTTSQAANTAMTRHTARTEIAEVKVAEDPLRTQNRVLSSLIVVVLAALIMVVVWATSQGDNNTEPIVPASINLNVGGDDTDTTGEDPNAEEPLFIPTAVPTATEIPAVLQVGGSIAYTRREAGQSDIWASQIDNREAIRLTNSPADERDPAWSPDGTRLAYASRQDDNDWNIYVQDATNFGGDPIPLTFTLGFEGGPVWSPDGAFIAYEGYQPNTHLDIFVVPVDGSAAPERLPGLSDTADFSPAWDPSAGRRIAYVSWRDGSKDIYLLDLTTGITRNITNTPNRNEDHPAWSPDGEYLAFSAVEAGSEKIFVKAMDNLQAPAEVFSQGREPTWSPDGTSIAFAVETPNDTFITVASFVEGGVATGVIQVPNRSEDPDWTSAPLPAAIVNAGGLDSGVEGTLYDEQFAISSGDPPYLLDSIVGVQGPEQTFLNERVNDSFNALRIRANERIGWDFLGELTDAFWDIDRRVQPGEPNRNWHKTGRAVAFNRNQGGFPADYEIVPETDGVNTLWRVYVRVAEEAQTGQLGEPLRELPWDFGAASGGDVEAYNQGGRFYPAIPAGYYVDLTALALDYGWDRLPAASDWRNNFNARNYWMLVKNEGLTWYEAMRQIYTEPQLGNFVPTATPAPIVPTEETPESDDSSEANDDDA